MSKNFILRTESVDVDILTELKKTNRLLCLYDSKINSLDKHFITSNKLDTSILKNLTMFVSNKHTNPLPPIIILNNLTLESINLIKSDPVLKYPQKYNISVIFIGTESSYDLIYN